MPTHINHLLFSIQLGGILCLLRCLILMQSLPVNSFIFKATSRKLFKQPYQENSNQVHSTFSSFSSYLPRKKPIGKSIVKTMLPTQLYLGQIRLVTPHATNRDKLLFRKSRLWGCQYSRHVTNRDVLVLATIRYVNVIWVIIRTKKNICKNVISKMI